MALGDGYDLLMESGDLILLETGTDSIQLETQPSAVVNTPYAAICRRMPWMRRMTVIPDGTIDQADRQAIGDTYGGILAAAPATDPVDTLHAMLVSRRLTWLRRYQPSPDNSMSAVDRMQLTHTYPLISPPTGLEATVEFDVLVAPTRTRHSRITETITADVTISTQIARTVMY